MLLTGSMVFAQNQNDPTIMTINGNPVSRSEFEYSYNKNNSEGVIDKKTVDEYVDLFINYKLKVQAAKDAHLDTLSSYKKEFLTYRDQQLKPSLVTDADVEAKARSIYDDTKNRIGAQGGMIMPCHILFALTQKATQAQKDSALAVANMVYQKLMKGADFAEMAKTYSADKGSAKNGGELPWICKGETVAEFENAAYALKVGEISKPVLSQFGYHIIKLKGKQIFFAYDSVKANIRQYIEARNLREDIANAKLDSISKKLGNGDTREHILDGMATKMSAKDSNLKYLIQEYHDGLLLYEISNRKVWDKAAKDEEGLASYFKKNKKKYNWDSPRFKGIAYHVKNEADVNAVKNSVKGKPFTEWATILRKTFNNDSIIRIRVEKGIFKEGDNAVIDKEVFKKDTTEKVLKEYPINATFGKILKKGPEDYQDVRALVVADYQEFVEKGWIEALREKYDFTIDKAVLATVNKH